MWTNDRLGERFDAIDQPSDPLVSEIVELRREMRAGFDGLQTTLNRIGGGLLIGLSGVTVAVITRGA